MVARVLIWIVLLSAVACLQPRAGADDLTPPVGLTAESASDPAALLRLAVRLAGEDDDQHHRRHNLYFTAASLQAEAGDLDGARRSAAALEGAAVARVHHHIARAQAEAGDFDGALQTVAEHDGDDVNLPLVYRSIARLQLEAGDEQGARQTMEQALEAIQSLVAPRPWTRVHIAVAFAEVGDAARAFELALQLDTNERRWAYPRIVRHQVSSGDVEGAEQTAEAIPLATERARAQRALATTQAEAGHVEGAEETVGEIRIRAERAMALVEIAELQRQDSDHDGVRRTLRQALDAAAATGGSRRDTVHRLIGAAYADLGDFADAEAAFELVEDPNFRAAAFTTLARARAAAGHPQVAREALERAEAARGDRDESESMRQLRTESLALNLAALGFLAEATALIERMEDSARRSSARGRIVEEQVAAGEIEGAAQLAAQIDDDRVRAQAYVSISEHLYAVEERDAARRTLREASERAAEAHAERPERPARRFREIIEAQAKIRDMQGLRQTLDAAGDPVDLRAAACRHVARAQVADGEPVETFLRWYGEIDAPHLRATALLHRAEALLEATR